MVKVVRWAPALLATRSITAALKGVDAGIGGEMLLQRDGLAGIAAEHFRSLVQGEVFAEALKNSAFGVFNDGHDGGVH